MDDTSNGQGLGCTGGCFDYRHVADILFDERQRRALDQDFICRWLEGTPFGIKGIDAQVLEVIHHKQIDADPLVCAHLVAGEYPVPRLGNLRALLDRLEQIIVNPIHVEKSRRRIGVHIVAVHLSR